MCSRKIHRADASTSDRFVLFANPPDRLSGDLTNGAKGVWNEYETNMTRLKPDLPASEIAGQAIYPRTQAARGGVVYAASVASPTNNTRIQADRQTLASLGVCLELFNDKKNVDRRRARAQTWPAMPDGNRRTASALLNGTATRRTPRNRR